MKYCIAGFIGDVRIFDILCISEIIVENQAHLMDMATLLKSVHVQHFSICTDGKVV